MNPFPLSTFLHRLHRDQRGAISLLSVFGIFLFTILLGQVMNIGRQIDDKLRMQNAADAAAYSGGVSIARGMNAIALSNHILCETFALTAYMREARDRHSDQFIPPVLAAWRAVGERYRDGNWEEQPSKFQRIGGAIVDKVPIEQQIVDQFSEMAFRHSRVTLPALELLLKGPENNPQDPLGGFIPRFQRAVVLTTPALAQAAGNDLARRYGQSSQSLHRAEPLRAFFWRTNVEIAGVGNETDPLTRTLPAVDPSPTGADAGAPLAEAYYCLSRTERDRLAHQYLDFWIGVRQHKYFDWFPSNGRLGSQTAKMSNYIKFFRNFACGQLNKLLNEEYPNTNLPHVLREIEPNQASLCGMSYPEARILPSDAGILESEYNFVATAVWPQMTTLMPGLFQNPFHRGQRSYAVTFAQAEVYVPRSRFRYDPESQLWAREVLYVDQRTGQTRVNYDPYLDNWPQRWDLFNQNWTVRLVPATASTLPQILQTHPQNFVPGVLTTYQAPQLGTTVETFQLINGH